MRLNRWIKTQLAIFGIVTVTAGAVMIFGYIDVPAMLGVGRYTVTMQLPSAGGLYEGANVTYRGTEVGRVRAVRLTDDGVQAELSLRSDVQIPSTSTRRSTARQPSANSTSPYCLAAHMHRH